MTPVLWYGAAAAGLFVIGLYGLFNQRHLLRKLLALNIASNGVFVLLIALAYRGPASPAPHPADPLPHTMVLTGIVVAVSATAFALALIRRLHRETGATTLPEDDSEGGGY